jgi:hypothetical protein
MWDGEGGGFPGIHIIEATPKSSPCPSERQSHYAAGGKDHIKMLDRFKRKRNDDNSIDSITEYPDENNHQYRSDPKELSEVVNSNSNNSPQSKTLVSSDNISQQPVIRRAPLASLSSFKMSSIECQDSSANGSVFDDSCADTDDDVDMEQFSTDSDEISLQSPPMTNQHLPAVNGSSLVKKCDVGGGLVVGKDSKASPVGESNESIERQRSNDRLSIRPASSSASDKKSNSSECVTINVVEYKNENDEKPSLKPSAPSSVILEMPVLAKQSEAPVHESAAVEPNPSGSARKWSKETLF